MNITIGNWKGRFEIFIIIFIIIWILFGHVLCSCSKLNKRDHFSIYNDIKEGFTKGMPSINTFSKVKSYPPDASKWNAQSLLIVPNEPLSQGVIDILDRKPQPIPLPPNQLLFFNSNQFKPECCTNSNYSNSQGCACMTLGQYKYLNERGGNNVPFSDF